MPTYTFKDPAGSVVSRRLTIAQFEQIREGMLELQDDAGQPLALQFNPGNTTLLMKDGPSGGWPSKVVKEGKYRVAHNRRVDQKTRDHVRKTKLIPNLNGVEAHSWADIQDEVRSKKGDAAAATYAPLVSKEKL